MATSLEIQFVSKRPSFAINPLKNPKEKAMTTGQSVPRKPREGIRPVSGSAFRSGSEEMPQRQRPRRFGKFLFWICLLYLVLVLYLAAYGIPTFITDSLF